MTAVLALDGVSSDAARPVWHPVPAASRVVLAHGCFDLLHLGHIRHLQDAKRQGDYLIVSVTGDAYVSKGIGRPVFTANERIEALKSITCVDEVMVNESADAVDMIKNIRPAVYVKGVDYADRQDAALEREIAAVTAFGGQFYITKTEGRWSSSRILNGEKLSEDAVAYLNTARSRGFVDRIRAAFERADKMAVAFIGETIVDEYRYVTPLGRPVKEFCLATVKARETESFRGGVVAAGKHAEWVRVKVITSSHMTMTKARFVDAAFNRKLFEVYSEREIELIPSQRAQLQMEIEDAVGSSDVVVVMDFGHGLLGEREREMVAKAKFLAVNAQTNTGNFGFNPVTKYMRADYVCVDEPEARLATGMQAEPIRDVACKLAQTMHAQNTIMTNGRIGCFSCYRHGYPIHTPALASNGIDTMGAGDAFLAVTAPLIAAGLDLEAAALVGNVAGAIKVGIVGHRRHVGRDELIQSVEALLK